MPPQKSPPKKATNLASRTEAPLSPRVVTIRAEPIELCQLLKFAGLSESGGQAKQVISEGKVSLNGAVETRKRKKVVAGDKITFENETVVVALG